MSETGALKSQLIADAYRRTLITPFYIAVSVTAFVIYVLCVIGMWKMFEKMGEKGWKALIPIYNMYILFDKVWNVRVFLLWIVSLILFFVLGSVRLGDPWTTVFLTLVVLLFIEMFVLHIILMLKLSQAFGKGIGYFLGLLFFNYIFLIVLGFGQSEYKL